MKPVFKEEMNYLGIDSKYENLLWVDSRCYYMFNKEMNKCKIGRSLAKLPTDISSYLTHREFLMNYYLKHTEEKVIVERDKLKDYLQTNEYDEIIISISGGKDSTVTEHMVRDICEPFSTRILFGNTTNETHYTYNYVKKMYGDRLEIANPKEGFNQWVVKNKFIPTKFGRACCSIFKEGNITPYLDSNKKLLHICGIRREESQARSHYAQIRKAKWESKEAQDNWNMYLPIIEFNDLDVWSYIFYYDIPFNKLYEFGYNRVGCTNCPYRTEYELELNEHFLPTYTKHWKRLLEYVFKEQGLAITLNCTLQEYVEGGWTRGIYRDTPTYEVIQDFADQKGITYEKAQKYFKSNRCKCGKRLSKDVIALNMKLLGRDTEARMCLKCLAEYLGTTQKQLKQDIEKFKQDGCQLF